MENLPAIAKLELSGLPRKAAVVAGMLREIANEKRLLILCELAGLGEVTVADLAQRVGLGQSAVSQHLARMRAKGIITFRREGASLHYAIADKRITSILKTLKQLYC